MTTTGVVVPVDVMQKIGVLTKNYEKWCNGKVDYLELRRCLTRCWSCHGLAHLFSYF